MQHDLTPRLSDPPSRDDTAQDAPDRGTHARTSPERLVERLVRDCGQDLVRFIARRLRSAVDARDLAQETYVRLLRLERKDLIRDPRPYLYRIACNVLYEFELGRKADHAGLRMWSAQRRKDIDAHAVDASADVLSLQQQLESTLKGLSPKC